MITPRSCSLQVSNIRALNTWLESWQHFMTVTCDNNVTMITDNISTFSPHGPFQFTASQALVCDGWASVRVGQHIGSEHIIWKQDINMKQGNISQHWNSFIRLLTKKEGNVLCNCHRCMYSLCVSLCQLQIVQFLTSDISHLYLHILLLNVTDKIPAFGP